MNKKILVIIISSLILIISIFGILMRRGVVPGCDFSDNRNHGMHMQRGDHKMRGNRIGRNFCSHRFMRQKLNLEESQIEKIQVLNEKFNREHNSYDLKKQPLTKELKELLRKKNPEDLKEIRRLIEKIYEVNIELKMIRIRQGMEISKILSPDQMKMLRKERKSMFKKRGPYFWQE